MKINFKKIIKTVKKTLNRCFWIA